MLGVFPKVLWPSILHHALVDIARHLSYFDARFCNELRNLSLVHPWISALLRRATLIVGVRHYFKLQRLDQPLILAKRATEISKQVKTL